MNPILRHGATLAFAALFLTGLSACGRRQAGDDVMAAVGGRNIYKADVERYYENQLAGSDQQPTGEQATSLRLNILRQLINKEILMRRAEKLGLLATDDEVDRRLNDLKSPFSDAEFTARLKDEKITLDDLKRDLRRALTVDKVLNKEITSKINVTDQDIATYFKTHRSEFNLIESQYHLAHIWVTTTPNPQVRNLKNDKAQNETDARKKIQMILNRLNSGDDFATLAMNYSEDTETSANGGDLGFTPESSLRNTDPATREIVSQLKLGQHSPIIPVVNPMTKRFMGFRIVKLLTKQPAGQRDLSDPRVQQVIRSQLRDRREQVLKAAYDEVMRDQVEVQNYYAEKILANNGAMP
jgi:peptidyl-prolyl cis-trans isomerase SurA